ncbi:MAG: ribonuclease E/G [Pseudomonadota bacterium]
MSKKMLVDATHIEETRVAVVDNGDLVEFDYESKVRKQLKGSVYLAKVTRVEPSLQAAFVNYGGNRHGFLPFSEIHPDYFRIPVSDREALLKAQQEEIDALKAAEDHEDDEILDIIDEEAVEDADLHDDEEEDDEAVVEVGGADKPADEEDSDLKAKEKSKAKKKKPAKKAQKDELKDTSEDGEEGLEKSSDDVTADDADAESENAEDHEGETSDEASEKGNHKGKRRHNRNRRRGRGNRRANMRTQKSEEIHDDGEGGSFRFNLRHKYKIQEVIKRGQIVLIQVSKEERGNKGAAVTSYLSLPGRYCVLMPNSPRGGGVSRKIGNFKDRKRMREILKELEIPDGMSVILRTAGVSRTKAEIKRDLDYLLRLWNTIREDTLKSTAPALINEEGNLIKRSIRDLYTRDIDEVLVSGEKGYKTAKDFMKMLVPSHAKKVKEYKDERIPLFHHYKVEKQISDIGQMTTTLKSGGYLVINPTEALVSIDVNSGKATKERHIEETALKTNLEAAEEVAKQLRLRDLGGLVVIDFIDMEERRNNRKVENKLRDALSSDRARIQVGRISSFGLLELSRQRLNPSLTEAQFETCPHCQGSGVIKTLDFAAISAMRSLEEEGIKGKAQEISLNVPNKVAVYILNNKREMLAGIEERYDIRVHIRTDDELMASDHRLDIMATRDGSEPENTQANEQNNDGDDNKKPSKKRNRRRGRRGGRKNKRANDENQDAQGNESSENSSNQNDESSDNKDDRQQKSSHQKKKPSKKSDGKKTQVEDKNEEKSEKTSAQKSQKKSSKKPASAKKDRQDKKDDKASPQSSVSPKKPSNDAGPADNHAAQFETVNAEPDKKKKGWWNRLID